MGGINGGLRSGIQYQGSSTHRKREAHDDEHVLGALHARIQLQFPIRHFAVRSLAWMSAAICGSVNSRPISIYSIV